MVEWLGKVSPVKMSIDPKHLQEDGLADTEEVLGESAALPNPLIWSRQEGTRRDLWVVSIGDACSLGWEHLGVVDFPRDPTLHQGDVLVGRELNGLKPAI